MSLIKNGSLLDFSVKAKEHVLSKNPILKQINTVKTLSEVSRTVENNSFEYTPSAEPRGIALKTLELTEGFEGFLCNLFNATNEVYFIAWAWDLSGKPVNQYPGKDTNPEDVIIKMKVGNIRNFMGEGINLFPKRSVSGGIALRIQLWESDIKERRFGKILTETADTIQKSQLNNLITLIANSSGISGVTITAIKEASLELAKLIGTILKANSDDYLDFYEGYFAADSSWNIGEHKYEGLSSNIVLNQY
jgi:hypothetical protein